MVGLLGGCVVACIIIDRGRNLKHFQVFFAEFSAFLQRSDSPLPIKSPKRRRKRELARTLRLFARTRRGAGFMRSASRSKMLLQLGKLIGGTPKHKVARESLGVAPNCPSEGFRFYAVQIGKVGIEEYFLAAHEQDAAFDALRWED
jgi:hypothetical protein